MRVVLLKPGDEALLVQAQAALHEQLSADRAAMLLADPSFVMAVALDPTDAVMGRIYGHVLHRPEASDLLLYEADVVDAYQRQGAGRAMIDAMAALSRARGYGEMWVLTECDNAAGNALYRSAGGEIENSPANTYVFHLKRGDDA